jgi:membrane-bound lytic murein transglycosylase D
LVAFAKAQGINYKTLKIYNPWLRSVRLLNPTHKRYVIEIPLSGL